MTIDEGIAKYKGRVEQYKNYPNMTDIAEEHKQLAEWLEELKAHRAIGTVEECKDAVENIERFYYLGYNKAIDDFVKECEIRITNKILKHLVQLDFASGLAVANRMLDEVAEQLKAGGEDGRNQ